MRKDDFCLRHDTIYSDGNIRTFGETFCIDLPPRRGRHKVSRNVCTFYCDTSLCHIPESSTFFFVTNMAIPFTYYSSVTEKCYNETNVRIANLI